jgi:hypothetical protein
VSARCILLCAVALLCVETAWAGPPSKSSETPHLRFVTEYVRELAEIEEIRADFDRQMGARKGAEEAFSISSYSFTRMSLELKSQAAILGRMHLNEPFDFLIPSLTEMYSEKVVIFKRLLETDRAMLQGPKDGVDYSKMASEIPELRAKLDDIDNSILKVTPAVFMTLIDSRPDSQNHLSHLIITRAERAELLDYINSAFGEKLSQKNPPYLVGVAVVLRDGLLKDYKCADEPWD